MELNHLVFHQKLEIENLKFKAIMLVIRFYRIGKRNQPSFKMVITDKRRSSKGGRFVEEVGFWNPLTKERTLKNDRIKYWLSVGAEPSPSIKNLLIEEKILDAKKIPVHKKKKGEAGKTGEAKPAGTSAKEPASAAKKETKPEPKKEEPKKEVAPEAPKA